MRVDDNEQRGTRNKGRGEKKGRRGGEEGEKKGTQTPRTATRVETDALAGSRRDTASFFNSVCSAGYSVICFCREEMPWSLNGSSGSGSSNGAVALAVVPSNSSCLRMCSSCWSVSHVGSTADAFERRDDLRRPPKQHAQNTPVRKHGNKGDE